MRGGGCAHFNYLTVCHVSPQSWQQEISLKGELRFWGPLSVPFVSLILSQTFKLEHITYKHPDSWLLGVLVPQVFVLCRD